MMQRCKDNIISFKWISKWYSIEKESNMFLFKNWLFNLSKIKITKYILGIKKTIFVL